MGVREYARSAGYKSAGHITNLMQAAEVFSQANAAADLKDHAKHLAEIHAAPRWLWPALVEKLLAEDLTVNDTKRLVAEYKTMESAPQKKSPHEAG